MKNAGLQALTPRRKLFISCVNWRKRLELAKTFLTLTTQFCHCIYTAQISWDTLLNSLKPEPKHMFAPNSTSCYIKTLKTVFGIYDAVKFVVKKDILIG